MPYGYITSKPHTYTIASGAQTGTTIDLKRPYKTILIECYDCDGFAAATSMGANVGVDSSSTMCILYEQDDPSTVWSKGNLPTTAVTLAFVLTHAFGFQRIQLDLDVNTVAEVVLKITGIDQGS